MKKYTESHEWIELAEDGKTGSSTTAFPDKLLLFSH